MRNFLTQSQFGGVQLESTKESEELPETESFCKQVFPKIEFSVKLLFMNVVYHAKVAKGPLVFYTYRPFLLFLK